MYSLEQLANKTIWMFREPRTGGTWITTAVQRELKRKPAWLGITKKNQMATKNQHQFDETGKLLNATSLVMNFHDFEDGFEHVQKYDNAILIRTTRRNKADILVSRRIRRLIGDYIISSGDYRAELTSDESQRQHFDSAGSDISVIGSHSNIVTEEQHKYIKNVLQKHIKPIVISQEEIDIFINMQKTKFDEPWNRYSSNYENETVYYEDVLESWSSSILPITLSMKNTNKVGEVVSGRGRLFTLKIPYDKKELILNYEQVVETLQ